MRDLDKDGRLLCEMQGKIFERSAKEYSTSSAVFVRRYMNSEYAAGMDREGFADRPADVQDAFASLDDQYGISRYGSVVYTQDELFWIGYIYRCWAYAYELSSRAVYKISSVTDMHAVYFAYHAMDPLNAVRRLMEAKGIDPDGECTIEAGVRLLREIRAEKGCLFR
jgi:hypothetical protein